MKFIYPAIFRQTEEGSYKGYFPDLEYCYGEGEFLEERILENLDPDRDFALRILMDSDLEDLTLEEGDIVRNISMNIRFYEGWDE